MCILFDLDGTLVDTAPDFLHALNHIRVTEGLDPLPLEMIRATVSHGMQNIITLAFGTTKAHPNNHNLYDRVLKTYRDCSGLYATTFPGILPLLNYLDEHQIPWGVVTNKQAALAEALLERLQLKSRVASIVGGDTTLHAKPHPEPLFHACREIGISPEECVYVGDAERDIQAGKSAGMATLAALYGYIEDENEVKTWGASHIIHHADEIKPWYTAWKKRI